MKDSDQLLDEYFSGELSQQQKDLTEEILLKQCPEKFFARHKDEALLDQQFMNIDMRDSIMQSVELEVFRNPVDGF